MDFKKLSLAAAASSLALVGVLALAGCSAGYSGGVAATVNGTEIAENTITDYIQSFREANSLSDDDAWADWMNTNSMTPESVRTTVLDHYVEVEMVKQLAADNDVTVEDSAIDEQVESVKSNYDSDSDWQSALSAQGFTSEQEYRDQLKQNMLEEALAEKVITDYEATDDEVLTILSAYASSYDGMRRSSHILFDADDEDTAKQVLSDLKSGKISWNDAVEKYSTDTGTVEDHGDVGWDKMNSFVDEYTDALDKLKKGEISGLVTSSYGIHIIKCTDIFNCPSNPTSLKQFPDALVETMRNYQNDSNLGTKFDEWLEDQEDEAEITRNDLPSDVPYNVEPKAADSDDESTSSDSDDSSDDSSSESTSATSESSESSSSDED